MWRTVWSKLVFGGHQEEDDRQRVEEEAGHDKSKQHHLHRLLTHLNKLSGPGWTGLDWNLCHRWKSTKKETRVVLTHDCVLVRLAACECKDLEVRQIEVCSQQQSGLLFTQAPLPKHDWNRVGGVAIVTYFSHMLWNGLILTLRILYLHPFFSFLCRCFRSIMLLFAFSINEHFQMPCYLWCTKQIAVDI